MTAYETERCPAHHIDVPMVSRSFADANGLPYGCLECRRALTDAPDAATLTPDERCAELHRLVTEPDFAGFDAVWHRVDQLVGRSTYTHELASPETLCAEIHGEGRLDPIESLRSLAGDKPIIVVEQSQEGT